MPARPLTEFKPPSRSYRRTGPGPRNCRPRLAHGQQALGAVRSAVAVCSCQPGPAEWVSRCSKPGRRHRRLGCQSLSRHVEVPPDAERERRGGPISWSASTRALPQPTGCGQITRRFNPLIRTQGTPACRSPVPRESVPRTAHPQGPRPKMRASQETVRVQACRGGRRRSLRRGGTSRRIRVAGGGTRFAWLSLGAGDRLATDR